MVRPVWDWEAANERKIDAVQQFAPFAEALDDIEARIVGLLYKVHNLVQCWYGR